MWVNKILMVSIYVKIGCKKVVVLLFLFMLTFLMLHYKNSLLFLELLFVGLVKDGNKNSTKMFNLILTKKKPTEYNLYTAYNL